MKSAFPVRDWEIFREIAGSLVALESLTMGADHGPSYSIEEISACGSSLATAQAHLNDVADPKDVQLVEVVDPGATIDEALDSFTSAGSYWADEAARLVAAEAAADLAKRLLIRLLKQEPSEVWEVRTNPRSWYEASWRDFLILIDETFLFLHLGISD